METILVYNKCVQFVEIDSGWSLFLMQDGRGVSAFARQTAYLDIPATAKTIEFFKSCKIDTPTIPLVEKTSWTGPLLSLGFQSFSSVSSSHKGYLRLSGFSIADFFFQDHKKALLNHNLAIRVDIETLDLDEGTSKFSFNPDVVSHVIGMHSKDVDGYLYPKHGVCLTFNPSGNHSEDKLLQNWTRSSKIWRMTVSLTLIITPKLANDLPDPSVSDHLIPYKRMRTDDTFADFTIIAENGTQFKCHRAVVAAQSSYFDRMLRSGMKEATSGTVELSGMTEKGVGAMLDYLYAWKRTVPEENAEICVELLEVGHKYDIQPMEECMKKILLSKPSEWFTPEAAFQLVLFVKDMDMGDLQQKAVKVYKARFAEIHKLSAYGELFKKRPEVVKQLFEFLSTC